jgi:hypothetical protein
MPLSTIVQSYRGGLCVTVIVIAFVKVYRKSFLLETCLALGAFSLTYVPTYIRQSVCPTFFVSTQ